MKTDGGQRVEIESADKSGMSIFVISGTIDGKPCHWTKDGKFRMDGKDDKRDLSSKTLEQVTAIKLASQSN